jgi:hypothetical protein
MVRKLSRHASETEHHGHETMPVSLGTLPRPTQPKQTNKRQRCSPRQYVRPAIVESRAIDRFASQPLRRPLSDDEDSAPAAVPSRTKRTDRTTNGARHADPPRVIHCGLARA